MLTTIRDYLPLKTILLSILVLALSVNKQSNSKSSNYSDEEDGDSWSSYDSGNLEQTSHNNLSPSFGILVITNDSQLDNGDLSPADEEHLCIVQFNREGSLPEDRKNMTLHSLKIFRDSICDSIEQPLSGSIVLVRYEVTKDCNVSTQALMIQKAGGSGVIFQLERNVTLKDINVNAKYASSDFVIAAIRNRSHGDIFTRFSKLPLANLTHVRVGVFVPPGSHEISYPFDLSIVVIWVIAVFTLTVGSYWSGVVRHSLYLKKKLSSRIERVEEAESSDGKKDKKHREEEPFLNISPLYVLFFVGCMAGMLFALYCFFKYLVWIIIGLFVMASILSVFVCLDPLFKAILPKFLSSLTIPCCWTSSRCRIYQLVVLGIAMSMSFTWFFIRHQRFSWILQDILGVFFSINMLRTIRLPNFKICTILLSLLFVYDVFFVFLTPYLTASGSSIMVEVATGGSKGGDGSSSPDDGEGSPDGSGREVLPMVIRVEHLSIVGVNSSDPLEVCYRDLRTYSHSLLGFGDILVPGLLVSYCHAFDLIHRIPKRPYFVVTTIAYAIGLVVTFVGLFLMKGVAQPALLYIVPCTLIPPILLALWRKEFRALWEGPGDGSDDHFCCHEDVTEGVDEDEDEDTDTTIPSSRIRQTTRATKGLIRESTSNTSGSTSGLETPPPSAQPN